MQRALALVFLPLIGCSAAASPTPNAGPAPTASAALTGTASATPPAPTAVASTPPPAAAALPPPREGTERRGYTLSVTASKNPALSVPISIDVPPSWGVEVDKTGSPEFLPCRLEERIFGKLSVGVVLCREGESADACIDNRFDARAKDKMHRESLGPGRAWAEYEKDSGRTTPTKSVVLNIYDPVTKNLVYCSAMLMGDDASFVSAYRAACESIALRPEGVPAASLDPSPARPDPNAKPEEPSPMADAARKFVVAMSHRDEKAAAAFLPDASLCTKKKQAEQKHCKTYVQKVRAGLKDMFPSFPADFEPGVITVKPAPGMPGLFSVHVHPKKDECAEGLRVSMSEVEGKPQVMFAVRVEEKGK